MTTHSWTGFQAAIIVLAMLSATAVARAAGALAIGTCDRYGFSHGAANPALANAHALARCASNGDRRCRVVINTRGNCGAFAIDAANHCGARGWGFAPNRRDAERIAVAQCFQYGGRNCRTQAWTCDAGP